METKWEKARADSPELFKRSLSLEEAAQRTASPWDEASGLARLSFWFVPPRGARARCGANKSKTEERRAAPRPGPNLRLVA
jgi:hypothetical protein